MQPLKIGVATVGFGLPIREGVKRAAAIGAQGLLLDARYELQAQEFTQSARRQFQLFLGELGLSLIGFNYPLRRPLVEPEDLDRRVDSLKQAMSLAAQFRVGLLTFRTGPIPTPEELGPSADFRRILEDLALYGNHVGVVPAVTPGGESPERLDQLLSEIKTGFVGIDCDPSCNLADSGKTARILRALHGRISHFRIRDAHRDLDGRIREAVVGRGEVDWTEIIPTLQEIEYHGWLTIDRTEGSDRIGDAQRAIEFLKTLFFGG